MWQVLIAVQAKSSTETTAIDHLTSALVSLSERRRLRLDQYESQLPGILWVLLLVGGMATVVSSCLLGNDKKWLHYCQVMALSFVIVATLAAIADLARPFEGAVSVSPAPMQRLLAIMPKDAAR
jgi:hypothetical protein